MPPHAGPHPPHGPHEWIKNEEKDRSIVEIAERLQKIGQRLAESSKVVLDGVEVAPANPSLFIIRYERLPRGELSLKLEIKWQDSSAPERQGARLGDLPIE